MIAKWKSGEDGIRQMEEMLTLKRFEEASEVVKRVTLETKLIFSDFLSGQTGNKVYLKPENMQFTGAYKLRGAYYKISTLTSECIVLYLLIWAMASSTVPTVLRDRI